MTAECLLVQNAWDITYTVVVGFFTSTVTTRLLFLLLIGIQLVQYSSIYICCIYH